MNKKRAAAVGFFLAAIAALIAFASTNAATGAMGGMSTTKTYDDGMSITDTQNPTVQLDSDSMQLVATGSTTAWFTWLGGHSCANYYVTWNDLGAGAPWKQTGASVWNASDNCYLTAQWSYGSNVDVAIKPVGASSTYCGSSCRLGLGQTTVLSADFTGTGTSVARLRWIQPYEQYDCLYVIPGGSDHARGKCF